MFKTYSQTLFATARIGAMDTDARLTDRATVATRRNAIKTDGGRTLSGFVAGLFGARKAA